MFWSKKKPKRKKMRRDSMIDIRELHRQGKVLGPNVRLQDLDVDRKGFIEVGRLVKSTGISSGGESAQATSTTDFIDVGARGSGKQFSSESDGYSKREVDLKIQELDRIIYKLEQRVELLERKTGVGGSSGSSDLGSVGVMGW